MTRARPHVFDGGRSSAVCQSLEPMLEELCGVLHADIAIALHTAGSRTGVLAAATAAPNIDQRPVSNEEVRLADALGTRIAISKPRVARDIVLTSLTRPLRIEFSTALICPWSDGQDGGVLLIGVVAGRWINATLDAVRRYAAPLASAHRDATYRGTMRLAEDLSAACKAVDHAELESTEPGEFLANIATIARSLMGTSTAYVAMPERTTGAFPFTTLVGIRTSAFRRLRMGPGQGLGGLARRERATVHTLDYGNDSRLRGAPVKETDAEGILSAICTPLIVDGTIQATLYLGDRRVRAFSRTDVDLLDAFSEHVSVRLSRQHIEAHRLSVQRHRERERLAGVLHDSVIRSLVEIGFHANEGRLSGSDDAVRRLLEEIGTAAGTTLERLRSELSTLAAARESVPCAGELVESLRLVPRRPSVERTFELRGLSHDTELPGPLIDSLVSIGEEALVNAERHSGCSKQTVILERSTDELRLRVLDDGDGVDDDAAGQALARGSGHLGLRGMRAASVAHGGHTRIGRGPGGVGTEVVAVLPLPATGL